MLDTESGYLDQNYNNKDLFYKCYLSDKYLTTNLQDSIESIDPTSISFSFFDIGLSQEEIDLFSSFEINNSDYLILAEDLHNLQEQTKDFLGKFKYDIRRNKTESVREGAKLITKLTSTVLGASGYDSALVILKTLPAGYAENIYLHRDKNNFEILGIDNLCEFENKYFFIFVLKGITTLYYQFNEQEKELFNSYAKDDLNSFGYYASMPDWFSEKGLEQKINISNYVMPEFGYGSVHLAGEKLGTCHAIPLAPTSRVILLIAPDEEYLIKR
ncbi:MAG: hypothetical protein HRU36_01155 [Rickettsiales bacterium]|nr:hypothetical protein [Rickettsiales bacterium]